MTEARTLRVAVAQMCSDVTHAANIATVAALAEAAAGQGAELLALPEIAGLTNRDGAAAQALVVEAERDPFIAACREIAARHGLWLHTGSTPVRAPDGRFLNRATLIDATGAVRASYDKVHLFDVDVEGAGAIRESERFAPGAASVLVDTPWGGFGLSICYDLRFPALYQRFGREGASVIFIPAAFTVPTGLAHWHVLLRARAIETGAFVIAPAQSGTHADGRRTYGHALAVDPWGSVLADLGEEAPKIAVVDLDLTRVGWARRQIPNLRNARDVPLTRA